MNRKRARLVLQINRWDDGRAWKSGCSKNIPNCSANLMFFAPIGIMESWGWELEASREPWKAPWPSSPPFPSRSWGGIARPSFLGVPPSDFNGPKKWLFYVVNLDVFWLLDFPMCASVNFMIYEAVLRSFLLHICVCFRMGSKKLLLFTALGKALCHQML